jgi:type II secretory pathway component PulF
MLDAGLPVSRVLQVLQNQATGRMDRALGRMEERIGQGESLAESMRREGGFPDLLVDMVEVGETSGTLGRTLAEAGRYYEFMRELWRNFISRIIWPAAQYVLAVAVLAVTFALLAELGQPLGRPGLVLQLGYGIPLLVVLAYAFVLRPLGQMRPVHEVVLRVPVLRSAWRSLALARFSLLMHLMTEAGVPLLQALPRGLRGTGNAAYAARADRATDAVQGGETLTQALEQAGLFPEDYLAMVAVAEESGKLAERFEWLAREYGERADTALKTVSRVVSALIWVVVAAVIITFVFFLASSYISGLKETMP